jgi:RNA polymerase sigma-70 factor (ECF subfamily)
VKDDAELIADALAGHSDSFGQLVQRYQNRLFNTMVHVTGAREEAEDVVQEAFVNAYLKLKSFAGHSAFYTWLYRIAFNISVSRKRRKRPEVSMDAQREICGEEPLDLSESPEQLLQRKERHAQIHAALQELSDEYRSILVLREMEGCCYETIAEMLNLPIGTVRSRIHRARAHLRDSLRGMLQQTSQEY